MAIHPRTNGSYARAHRALSLVLDYEADVAEIEAFTAHLGCCAGCRRYTAHVAAFTRYLGRLAGGTGTRQTRKGDDPWTSTR
jgi:predicted anti-sigma-YlaC factor YlaD